MTRRDRFLPPGDGARWAGSFALAVALHAGAAAMLLARWTDAADPVASAPALLVDLAPVAAAPVKEPTEQPPDLRQTKEAQPETRSEPRSDIAPWPAPEQMPDPASDAVMTAMPPPRPPEPEKPKARRERRASLASAPSQAEHKAERAAAAAPGAVSHDANAIPSWRSLVAAQLERNKRYPPDARARGEQGVAQLAFSIDRGGGVHGARIARSSGSGLLDRETLDLIQRAQPLPPPPPELSGTRIAITVPIRYTIR